MQNTISSVTHRVRAFILKKYMAGGSWPLYYTHVCSLLCRSAPFTLSPYQTKITHLQHSLSEKYYFYFCTRKHFHNLHHPKKSTTAGASKMPQYLRHYCTIFSRSYNMTPSSLLSFFSLLIVCNAFNGPFGAAVRSTSRMQLKATSLTDVRRPIVDYMDFALSIACSAYRIPAVVKQPTIVEEVTEKKMFDTWQFKTLDSLMSVPIIHDLMFGVYRKNIVKKSEAMGLPWSDIMEENWKSLSEFKATAEAMTNPQVTIPSYFYAPIHAYKDGNLCWESAIEEDLWSKLMIAPLYQNALDGDVQMRQKWLSITGQVVKPNPKSAADLGCGTGLSMYMIDSKWPSIESVTGIDLSTYKLAISQDKKKEMTAEKAAKYTLLHGLAEATPLPDESQDLVTLCLVAHESPAWVSKNIFMEAFRILKPGGSFTLLDLDKENLENLLTNPFVAAIYKQTEPYMKEFLSLNPREDLEKIGFKVTAVDNASRSHKVFVAQKPE